MNMLYILVPLTLGVLVIAIWALLWAIRNRQFDDLESEGWSVVLDDDRKPRGENQRGNSAENIDRKESGRDE